MFFPSSPDLSDADTEELPTYAHMGAQTDHHALAPHYLYIPPTSGIFAFHEVINTFEILPSDEDERKSIIFLKFLARIVAGFAISYFSYGFLYYNAISFAFKSASSAWSYIRQKEVFHYRHTDYNKDIDKHIRHAIIDMIFYFSSYIPPLQLTIVMLYATFPKNFIEIAKQAVYYKFEVPQEAQEAGE